MLALFTGLIGHKSGSKRTVTNMTRHDTSSDSIGDSADADNPDQEAGTTYLGFPASAVPDKPGREREYTLDRIERTVGSIL